ncbi:MAG: STAS domain-containing protein [Candidatus Kapaibacterium sp.]|nr:STAS domain-containing protein [Bacteroidota bacterium]
MKFLIEQDDNVVVFTLKENRLDSLVAPDVKAELLIVCQPNIEALIIDLSKVDYADSTGLSCLLLAHRQLKEHDAPVVLVGVRETVRNLLRISQMEWLFEFYETVEQAFADMQTEGGNGA